MSLSIKIHIPFRTDSAADVSCVPERKTYATTLPGQTNESTVVVTDSRQPLINRTGVEGSFWSLAIACAYLLLGEADVVFPSSAREKPSREARIVKTFGAYLRGGDASAFPQIVDWRVWDRAIVPVLEDGAVQALAPINRTLSTFDEYVRLLEGHLLRSLKEQGFIPQSA